MNAGDLKEKIYIKKLKEHDRILRWENIDTCWAKVEHKNSRNLFSSVGCGAQTVLFTIRTTDLSLHDAIHWGGNHYFITTIAPLGRRFLKVTTATSVLLECSIYKASQTYNELGNPVSGEANQYVFPACITEKYVGYAFHEPRAVHTTCYVFITPKCVELEANCVIFGGPHQYAINKCHTLDPFKNEYEAVRKDEP